MGNHITKLIDGHVAANNLQNGYLTSSDKRVLDKMPRGGSFYLAMVNIINQHLAEHGDWVWLKNCITNESLMASDVEKIAQKFAVVLHKLGFGKGDSIHFCLDNDNYVFPLCGGAWLLGGTCSTGNAALDSKAIASQVKDLKARIVVCNKRTSAKVLEATGLLASSPKEKNQISVLCLGANEGCIDLLEALKETTEGPKFEPVEFSDVELETELCIVLWSSGTTGKPKGIGHTHTTSWNIVRWIVQETVPHSPVVSTSCFFHMTGYFFPLCLAFKRQTIYHMFGAKVTFQMILEALAESQCTWAFLLRFHYVPLVHAQEFKDFDKTRLSNLNAIVTGGTSVPLHLEEMYKASLPSLKLVINAYGMTENGLITSSPTTKHLGHVTPGGIICIKDIESDKVLGANQQGEICIKTASWMKGYLNSDDDNDMLDKEGFAHTGDMGFYDDDANLHFVDRFKAMIKLENGYVAPAELESLLENHPMVKESFVFSMEGPIEKLSAIVVLTSEKSFSIDEKEIRSYINGQVPDFKKIVGPIILRRDPLPINNSGKLVRQQLKVWARNQQDCKQQLC